MDLIKELGLENFSEEQKNALLVQFTDSLIKRLMLRVGDKLNDEEKKEFDKLVESKDTEKINAFLNSKVPDLDQVRDEEMGGLVEEMQDFIKDSKK